MKRLDEVSNKIVDGPFGSQLKVEEYVEEGIPLIRVKDIKDGELDETGLIYITPNKQEQLHRSRVLPGDILLTKAGSIGNAAIFPPDLKEANITSHLAKIEVKEGINARYVCEYLNTRFARLQISRLGSKTTRPELNLSEVSSILIILPPNDIQNKVIQMMQSSYQSKRQKEAEAKELLSSIDGYISKELRIKPSSYEQKSCYPVMSSSIEGRLDPYFYTPDFRDLQNNILAVAHRKLGEVIDFSNEIWDQKSTFKEKFPYIEIGEVDVYTGEIKHIQHLDVADAPSRARMIIRQNDIIVSTTRPNRGAISLIGKSKDGFIASTGFAVLRQIRDEVIDRRYLFYILRSDLCLTQMLQRSSGGNYPAITSEELRNVLIPTPPNTTQRRIAEEIQSRIDKIEKLQQQAADEIGRAKAEVEKIILR